MERTQHTLVSHVRTLFSSALEQQETGEATPLNESSGQKLSAQAGTLQLAASGEEVAVVSKKTELGFVTPFLFSETH